MALTRWRVPPRAQTVRWIEQRIHLERLNVWVSLRAYILHEAHVTYDMRHSRSGRRIARRVPHCVIIRERWIRLCLNHTQKVDNGTINDQFANELGCRHDLTRIHIRRQTVEPPGSPIDGRTTEHHCVAAHAFRTRHRRRRARMIRI